MNRTIAGTIAASLMILLAGCGGSSTKSEAFCADLRAGMSPMSIYSGVRDDYTPEKFADLAYGFAAMSCKEQLSANEGLRAFLQAWNINPDA